MDLKTQHEIRERIKKAFLHLTPDEFSEFIESMQQIANEGNPEAQWLCDLLLGNPEKTEERKLTVKCKRFEYGEVKIVVYKMDNSKSLIYYTVVNGNMIKLIVDYPSNISKNNDYENLTGEKVAKILKNTWDIKVNADDCIIYNLR